MHSNSRRQSLAATDFSLGQRRAGNVQNKYRTSLDAFIKEQRKITSRVEEFQSDDNQSQSSTFGGGNGGGLLSQLGSNSMARVENTFRLEPQSSLPKKDLKEMTESIMRRMLDGKDYDHEKLGELTKLIPEEVKLQAKNMLNNCLGGYRYKVVAHTTIGQLDNQGILVGSRCLWNTSFDHEIVASFSNRNIFAITAIYASYFE
ncbi:dynein light chain Tctex-type 5-like [Convolutriloba macropyga]|uniref:dynein light chain Tctex-type 5-like n=1 Tax=Convolutriloba macropyga TaxID=536237 RepID=UPI003F5254DD